MAALKSAVLGLNPNSASAQVWGRSMGLVGPGPCRALTLSSCCKCCLIHRKHQALLQVSQVPEQRPCVWEHELMWVAFCLRVVAPHVQLCGQEAGSG